MEFLGAIALIGLAIGLTALFIFLKSNKDRKADQEIAAMKARNTVRCPGCQKDLKEDLINEIKKKENAYKTDVIYKCGCGRTSTWDVVGNPPVLKEDVSVSIKELRKTIKTAKK